MLNKGGNLLFFEATHTHPATICPMLNAEGKANLKNLFSDENVKKAGVKIAATYMNCPNDTSVDHKGFFTVEAYNDEHVKKYFCPMAVEVRPVQPLSEVAKML